MTSSTILPTHCLHTTSPGGAPSFGRQRPQVTALKRRSTAATSSVLLGSTARGVNRIAPTWDHAMAQSTAASPPRPRLQRSNASAHPVMQSSGGYQAGSLAYSHDGPHARHHPTFPHATFSALASASADATPLGSPLEHHELHLTKSGANWSDGSSQRSHCAIGDAGAPRAPSRLGGLRGPQAMDMFRSSSSESTRPPLKTKSSRKDLKEAAAAARAASSPLPSNKSGSSSKASKAMSSATTSSSATKGRTSGGTMGGGDDDDGWNLSCTYSAQFEAQRLRRVRDLNDEPPAIQQKWLDTLFRKLSQKSGIIVAHHHQAELARAENIAIHAQQCLQQQQLSHEKTSRASESTDENFLDFSRYINPIPTTCPVPNKDADIGAGTTIGERTPRPEDYPCFKEHAADTKASVGGLSTGEPRPLLLRPQRSEASLAAAKLGQGSLRRVPLDPRRSPSVRYEPLPPMPQWAKNGSLRPNEGQPISQGLRSPAMARTQSQDSTATTASAPLLRPTPMHRAMSHDVGSADTNEALPRMTRAPVALGHAAASVSPTASRPSLDALRSRAAPGGNMPQQRRAPPPAPLTRLDQLEKSPQRTHNPGSASVDSTASDSGASSGYSSVPQTPVSRVHMLSDAPLIQGTDGPLPPFSSMTAADGDNGDNALFLTHVGLAEPHAYRKLEEVRKTDGKLSSWDQAEQLAPFNFPSPLPTSLTASRAEISNDHSLPHKSSADMYGVAIPPCSARLALPASTSPPRTFLASATFDSQDSQLTVRAVHGNMRSATPQGRPRAASAAASTFRSPQQPATDYGAQRKDAMQVTPHITSRTSSSSPVHRYKNGKSRHGHSPSVSSSVSMESNGSSAASSDASGNSNTAASVHSTASSGNGGAFGSLLSYMRGSPKGQTAASPTSSASNSSQTGSSNAVVTTAAAQARRLGPATLSEEWAATTGQRCARGIAGHTHER